MAETVFLIDLDDYVVVKCERGSELRALRALDKHLGAAVSVEHYVEPEAAAKPEDRHWLSGSPTTRNAYYVSTDGGKSYVYCFRDYAGAEARLVLDRWIEKKRSAQFFNHTVKGR